MAWSLALGHCQPIFRFFLTDEFRSLGYICEVLNCWTRWSCKTVATEGTLADRPAIQLERRHFGNSSTTRVSLEQDPELATARLCLIMLLESKFSVGSISVSHRNATPDQQAKYRKAKENFCMYLWNLASSVQERPGFLEFLHRRDCCSFCQPVNDSFQRGWYAASQSSPPSSSSCVTSHIEA